MKIAICDDERIQTQSLTQKLSLFAETRHKHFEIQAYSSAEAFLFAYRENRDVDILFLDIEMGQMNGIELAREIRADNETVQIVFITGYPDYIGEGYDVDALHYLLKPVKKEKLFAVLDRYITKCRTSPQLLLPCEDGTVRVAEDMILFCEAMGKKTHLHMSDGRTLICTTGISKLTKEFSSDFIPCHRSYLIHLRYIRSIGKTAVIMDNGQELPLSRRLYENVNRAFITYYKEKLS